MPTLIDTRGIPTPDAWQVAADLGALQSPGPWLLPLQAWLTLPPGRPGAAPILAADDDPLALRDRLGTLPLIAVDFAAFQDGRGLSHATLLRRRLQFTGELRAIGDIVLDLLPYLRRCGFSTFALRDDQRVQQAAGRLAIGAGYQRSDAAVTAG